MTINEKRFIHQTVNAVTACKGSSGAGKVAFRCFVVLNSFAALRRLLPALSAWLSVSVENISRVPRCLIIMFETNNRRQFEKSPLDFLVCVPIGKATNRWEGVPACGEREVSVSEPSRFAPVQRSKTKLGKARRQPHAGTPLHSA